MQWSGEGLIIGVRRHGESSVIAEVMVEGRGRHMGMVRGGRSPKQSAGLQAGNSVQLTWRARLEEHLGTFTLEVTDSRAANLIADRTRLYAAQLLCDHLRLLPERDPHDRLLGQVIWLLDATSADELGAALARFELMLLEELGFGLDLLSCAVTGTTSDLTHVSPKSGRAVSRAAAEPYLDRLFPLPAFLIKPDAEAGPGDVAAAFALTGHFLDRHVWMSRQLDPPAVRHALIEILCR
ncbi:MAG TPA: DNA repair protein RecO [Devosiaceae bacterium]|nr:DNA repair protein RecO [Devosiaceae bacterium]